MRALADLLRTQGGIEFLARQGFFVCREHFLSEVRPPAKPGLAHMLGVDRGSVLVYVGQQVCADYVPATMTKFELARDLSADGKIVAAILWHDMYQADADRFGARLVPPEGRGIWFVARKLGAQEPRFLHVDRSRLEEVFAGLEAWIDAASLPNRALARSRVQQLIQRINACTPLTLADVTRAMAEHLLREELGFEPSTALASQMADFGLFTSSVNEVLANLDAVRRVFNAAVEDLLAEDIDPQVRPLADDYLPLHYSDPVTGERLRLRYERSGPDHWAVASKRNGERLRFHLGHGRPSLGELEAGRRWSLDVSMPIYHNDLASGWIAGRSTALYGLVFNRVLRDVLGQTPIPALVPPQLGADAETHAATILFAHLLNPALHGVG